LAKAISPIRAKLALKLVEIVSRLPDIISVMKKAPLGLERKRER